MQNSHAVSSRFFPFSVQCAFCEFLAGGWARAEPPILSLHHESMEHKQRKSELQYVHLKIWLKRNLKSKHVGLGLQFAILTQYRYHPKNVGLSKFIHGCMNAPADSGFTQTSLEP